MKRKIMYGMLALAVLSMIVLSGCQSVEKQKCIQSGGTWLSGKIGYPEGSISYCKCPTIDTYCKSREIKNCIYDERDCPNLP